MNTASWLTVTGLAAACALAASDPAGAIKSNAFTYAKPKIGAYAIGTADMQPEGTDAQNAQFSRSAIYLSIGKAPGEANCMIAAVHVPQGAKLIRVAATYESGIHSDPFYRVTQVFFGPDRWFEIARFNPRVDNNSVRHTTAAKFHKGTPRVDNTKYNYVFEFCMGYGDVFYGARVFYEYKNAGD